MKENKAKQMVKRLMEEDAAAALLQSCPTLQPHRQQPTRLPHPWDSPGNNTGVGCHFLKSLYDEGKELLKESPTETFKSLDMLYKSHPWGV